MTPATVTQTVFLVDDDPGALRSLSFLIQTDNLNVESYQSAQAFLDQFDMERSGCLVADVRMPEMSGLDLQRILRERGSQIPIIFLTAHGDLAACRRAFRDGAVDFLEKTQLDDQALLNLIRTSLERDLAARKASRGQHELLPMLQTLTDREREVMDRLVAGRTVKQIATEFDVSIQTIAKHRTKLLEKLKVENDIELVRMILGVAATK
ncbi:Response regulator protein TodT [Anatilimnocola aggregata]|uniref:Response regulator protein TodT n=1 Tax=Anatilimnocola aggregata TaxID=2528021 RepID=A0A517YER5_9BACT|nr:response regulator [Anatilimnocola aggregata]QDU28730.1 Response regulator protein TodT [Anatilimnocola aggregata]